MSGSKLKAYIVNDKWGDAGSIVVWASTPGRAKTQALMHDEFDRYDFIELCVKRAPNLDKYVFKKRVPIAELLKMNWWFYCSGCLRKQIDQDDIDNGTAYIEMDEGDPYDFVEGAVICSECKKKLERKQA